MDQIEKSIARAKRREARRATKKGKKEDGGDFTYGRGVVHRGTYVDVDAYTETQGYYILAIKNAQLTFGTGPAGTGKTFVATSLAANALASGETAKIIITRPAVEAGFGMGFLPGTLAEKYEPYIRPFRDVFEKRLGVSQFEYFLKNKIIEALPLDYMRGMTFEDCWVILDEAQNTTPVQMKLFLTRIGENCKVIINGDLRQKDITGPSGLQDAIDRLDDLRGVRVIEFTREDVVRSGLVQDIIERYES